MKAEVKDISLTNHRVAINQKMVRRKRNSILSQEKLTFCSREVTKN